MHIVVADDHALFRDGLTALLDAWGHVVVAQAANGDEAVAQVEAHRPDLVLMDVRMPGTGGIEATRRIAADHPSVAIVMLTVSEDEEDLFDAIRFGARGYLLKSLEGAELRTMIDAVARGEAAMAPATAHRIIRVFAEHRANDVTPGSGTTLTVRERGVLALVTEGLRNREIAARLGVSEHTVKFHLRNILEKLHAVSRTELAARAARDASLLGD
jgi:DNA-binding NarL/FixJ family response regulator